MTKQNKKIPKKFVGWAKAHFKDNLDLLDVEHEYDRSLSVEENEQIFREKFGNYFVEKQPKMTKKEMAEAEAMLKKDDNLNALESRFGVKIEMV